MPKVPLIQFQVVAGADGDQALYALDMNGRLWGMNFQLPGAWFEVEGPDDSGGENRAWGKHD